MTWIVQNRSGRVINLRDIGVMLYPNQTRDLDTMGREVAENSADLQQALKNQTLVEIKKDGQDSEESELKPSDETNDPVSPENPEPEPSPRPEPEPEPRPELPSNTFDRLEAIIKFFPQQARAYRKSLDAINAELAEIEASLAKAPEKEEDPRLRHRKTRLQENQERMLANLGVEEDHIDEAMSILRGLP